MVRLIALTMLIASCAKGGVELVITPDSDQVTRVVLYVGVGDADTDPIMPAMHGTPFPSSSAWSRDSYNELDVREVSGGEPVVFQFQENEDADEALGVVIAVGFAGDQPVSAASKRGIDVPSDVLARYELALEPISNASTTTPLFLDIWQPQPGSPKAGKTCVALYDKRESDADAVVTHGDPDCDGWPTDDPKECQPHYYMSFSRPTLEDAACLLTERVVTNDTVSDGCVLGGPPCRDGFGKETSCTAPTPYCVPKSVCNRCAQMPGDINCARDITPFALQYPTHLHCKLYFDLQGKLCAGTFKALSQPGPDIAGRHCVTGSENPVRITSAGLPWSTSVQLQKVMGLLKVDVKNLQSNCNFDIVVAGDVGARQEFGGMVAGMLDNGRGIAIPIVFDADPLNIGCENQTACQATWSWDLTELVDQCINTPVFPP
jgi:hypothetical protein